MVYGVVLAGGKGERFWPLSRVSLPKQFLQLTSDKTMLDETIQRVLPLIPIENIRIVTSERMRQMILSSMDYVGEQNILNEPVGRNTCMAIGLAAAHLLRHDPQAVMVVLSADHLIRPAQKLLEILQAGIALASAEDRLITIGITPTRPETNYGYIRLGAMYKYEGNCMVYAVSGFTEKPKAQLAHEYYYTRNYLWNSGMFVWSAGAILKAIGACQPELGELISDYTGKIGTGAEVAGRAELYEKAASVSIDVAVLERAENVLTIKADIVWDDIGGWRALERYKITDRDNNVVVGEAAIVDTYETTVYNHGDGIIAVLGVSDLVVVRSDNITMVAHRTKVNEVKKILDKLEAHESTRKYL
ncbi:MAG TPA: sugar phosphate nucleotidyltransferase [Candidatus Deferrimicrobium sp.]|nr:sugar phosphate nucleotidyltransferase [Candidatus Deferrimicrobium sp.]